jgi:acetylornithine deacetylase/succinyl-diaminopimelate desuccinylase-like protein
MRLQDDEAGRPRGMRRVLAVLAVVGGLIAPSAAQAQESEVVTLLRDLVRINNSNPPGNEAQVAEFLAPRLRALGFEVDIIQTPTPGKAHLVARLRAADPTERPILLAGHEDTVGVEPELWTLDPFGGAVSGGYLYGRGALDFKGGLAAFTVAVMRLARSGAPLKRDVILLAEADEEGGSYGTRWLADNHWDKIDAGVSLNEGGWIFKDGRGRPRLLGITTIDKNSLSVTVSTRGTSTHSSRPLPDSAIRRLVRALHRIERFVTTPRITPTARRYLRTWAKAFGDNRLRRLANTRNATERFVLANQLKAGRYGELFNGLVRDIYVPTIVDSGFRSNVLPGTATATVNMRMLPGTHPRPMIRQLRRAIGDRRVTVEPIVTPPATVQETLESFDERAEQRPSSTDTDLYRSLVRQGRAQWAGVRTTPALFEAGTDAVPWRERGIPVYGVYPYPIDRSDLVRMHGNDERVPVSGLEQGTDWITRVLAEVASR